MTLQQLVLHETTRRQLECFLASPSHSLLLTGPPGIGKSTVAHALATEILGAEPNSHPYVSLIAPEGLSISIEAIRQLQKFLLLKTIGERPIRRIAVIEQAELLTTEAQNAFLKLLEEPPADTIVMLTARSPHGLLPTIMSRVQHIAINQPAPAQVQALLEKSLKDETARQQAYFLSGGLPGLLQALLNEEQEHPLLASVNLAKELLQKTPFERLAAVDTLSKQKEATLGLVEALKRIAEAGLNSAGAKGERTRIVQWHRLRKAALKASEALKRSANAKLVLDDLLLSL